jgi:hypothetical protein
MFSGVFAPLFIAIMQFLGAFVTEIINILVICSSPTIMEVIMNFIALGAIAEIDNYYLGALPVCELKDALGNSMKVSKKSGEIKFRERNIKSKVARIIYRTFRVF